MTEDRKPLWVKSSRCSGGSCVEVARVADQYMVRDSKNPATPPLMFSAEEWKAFCAGVLEGEFDFR